MEEGGKSDLSVHAHASLPLEEEQMSLTQELPNAFNQTVQQRSSNDYGTSGNFAKQRLEQSMGINTWNYKNSMMNLNSMFKKKQVAAQTGGDFNTNQSNRKKTTRLFNVQNQSTNSFLKASDVLLNPFSMSERNTD